jgi:hypothetical protein
VLGDDWEGNKQGHAWREAALNPEKKVFDFLYFEGEEMIMSQYGWLLDMGNFGW